MTGSKTLLTGFKSFLGRVRTAVGTHSSRSPEARSEELAKARQEVLEKTRKLQRTRRQLKKKDREITELRMKLAGSSARGGVDPANIIWIFGTARTGSTWLGSMFEELSGHFLWREPYVGDLFGSYYYKQPENRLRSYHHILGRHEEAWLGSIRHFVLEGARARFPELTDAAYLTIKEPHGSTGAPLLMKALPESRMVFLVRDPRDVASSALDARRKGSLLYERRQERLGGGDTLGGVPPDDIVRERARKYLQDVKSVKAAYEAHGGHKTLVRYEDLRANTLESTQRLFAALNMAVDEEELAQAVERHSFESLPEEKKGKGKFYRRAAPGGWREDLSPEQAKVVEEITAPLLAEFYPS